MRPFLSAAALPDDVKTPRALAALAFLLAMLSLPVIPFVARAADSPVPTAPAVDGAAASYRLEVRLDPQSRALVGAAEVTLRDSAPFDVVLDPRFEMHSLKLDGRALALRPRRDGAVNRWSLPAGATPSRTLELAWRGDLAALAPGLEHRDTLHAGAPVADPRGSFLPAGANWYPAIARGGRRLLHSYSIELDLPAGQRGLVAGHRGNEETRDGRTIAAFAFPHPSEGIDLIAGPYRVEERLARSIDGRPLALRTYFHDELDALASGYLDAVVDYVALYERWIGPYPFTTFSVVSSPTPTGFGMPTMTYLGIEVLKLPFIKATSLGHEVLHNWWGNGVYPDYETGNWSEGLTTFMADYHYAERDSGDKARAMRLAWLRDLSGIPPGADRPLATFTSRTHGIDQAVGYGKAAMVFLMLRDRIGEPAFDRGLRRFWQTHRFRTADWSDLRVAFEAESGQRLDLFFAQWLERSGLAEISLVEGRAGDEQVAVTLTQSAPPYVVEVPLRVATTAGESVRRVRLEHTEQRFELEIDDSEPATRVTLDPDSRLLRRLHRREAPPILRELQLDRNTSLVALGDAAFTAAARALAARLLDEAPHDQDADDPPPAGPLLVIGDETAVERWLARHALAPPPREVAGRGTTRMWTQRLPSGAPLAIVAATDPAALTAAARPLPHYRQQSWLVFDGPRAVARGVWSAQAQSVPVTRP